MDKVNIIVCCHKEDPHIRTGYPYVPVHGGKALHPDVDLGFIGDDGGDNVSVKNLEWCEMTPLYWAWKNLPETEYVGLAHYRRYFDIDDSDEGVDSLMAGCDIVVNKGLRVREAGSVTTFEYKPVSGHRTFNSALDRKLFFTLERWMKDLYFRLFTTVGKNSFIVADDDVITWLARDGVSLRVLDKPLYRSK